MRPSRRGPTSRLRDPTRCLRNEGDREPKWIYDIRSLVEFSEHPHKPIWYAVLSRFGSARVLRIGAEAKGGEKWVGSS